MIAKEDVERGENSVREEISKPLLQQQNKLTGKENGRSHKGSKEQARMVYLSTFVAVCGSFEFGSCTGYSSPTQSAIREDLNLSLEEFSVFSSVLTFGAMIGGITSGPIADFIGRKGVSRSQYLFVWFTGTFLLYGAVNALAILFVIKVVPGGWWNC